MYCTKPIKLAISLFSGFLQNSGSAGSGLVDIENEIHHLICGHSEIKVRLYPWKVNVSDVAESIWRLRNSHQKHIVIGYSYGGQTAVNFIRELETRGDGVRVSHLFLCDAVRRWRCLPGVAAATGMGVIKIPEIVDSRTWFIQTHPRWSFYRGLPRFTPAGHKLRGGHIPASIELDAGHSYIDNHTTFKSAVLDRIKQEL